MSVNNGESLKVNFMTRLKRRGPEVDKFWIFPGEPDCHTIQTSSVIDIVPHLDLDLNLTSSRVVVMVLNNYSMIRRTGVLELVVILCNVMSMMKK